MSTTTDTPLLVTVEQAAVILFGSDADNHRDHIRQLRRDGELSGRRIGKRWWITTASLTAYADADHSRRSA